MQLILRIDARRAIRHVHGRRDRIVARFAKARFANEVANRQHSFFFDSMVTDIVEGYQRCAEERKPRSKQRWHNELGTKNVLFAQDKPAFYGVGEDVGVAEGWARAAAGREASARAAAARAALAGIGSGGIVGNGCSLDSAYLRRIDASQLFGFNSSTLRKSAAALA